MAAVVDPGPELLAARERFLQACIDAPFWNPPYRKPDFNPRPAKREVNRVRPLTVRGLRDALETSAIGLAGKARQARDDERAMIDIRQQMPNNYWLRRRRAEQRLAAATAMMDALSEV